jgi:hypothetical protein
MIILRVDDVLIEREIARVRVIKNLLAYVGKYLSEEVIYETLYDLADRDCLQWVQNNFIATHGPFLEWGSIPEYWKSLDIRPVKNIREFSFWLPKPSVLISDISRRELAAQLSRIGLYGFLDSHRILRIKNHTHDDYIEAYSRAAEKTPLNLIVALTASAKEVFAAKSVGVRTIGFVGASLSPAWLAGTLLAAGVDEVTKDLNLLKERCSRALLMANAY